MANPQELILRAYLDQVQLLNDAAIELIDKTSLISCTGVQLDGIGQIIGLPRQGLDDDHYRAALNAWIRVNISGGTIDDLNHIVLLATHTLEADDGFSLIEDFPASFKIDYTFALGPSVGTLIAEAIYQGKAAGVYGIFEYFETEPVFAFDAIGGSKFDGGWYLKTAIRNRAGRESELL